MVDMEQTSFRAQQLREWFFSHFEFDFLKMSNIPQAMALSLDQSYTGISLSVHSRDISIDGSIKWVLKSLDNHYIECVLIPEGKRHSLCISSQIGCAMGCKFCHTAKMGFIRNLQVHEIIEQVLVVNHYLDRKEGARVSNILFMGMGEPLNNMSNVAAACGLFTDGSLFGLSARRVCVSTSGPLNKLNKWVSLRPQVRLAISLHGSSDTLRRGLMPVASQVSIESLLRDVDEYVRVTGQRVTFEYILIKGHTCSSTAAAQLKQIASQRNCKINLIIYNGGEEGAYAAPGQAEIDAFYHELACGGFPVMVRKPRGRDISAACGQLVQLQKKVA